MEVFKTIKNFNNYEVSNYGHIRKKNTNKYLGYLDKSVNIFKVRLTNDRGLRKLLIVHKLVLETFNNNLIGKNYKVYHINNDPRNCSLDNLNYVIMLADREINLSDSLLNEFNNFDVYAYVGSFLNKHTFVFTKLYNYDDVLQEFAIKIWRSLPIYEKKYKKMPLVAYINMVCLSYRKTLLSKILNKKNNDDLSIDNLIYNNNYDYDRINLNLEYLY